MSFNPRHGKQTHLKDRLLIKETNPFPLNDLNTESRLDLLPGMNRVFVLATLHTGKESCVCVCLLYSNAALGSLPSRHVTPSKRVGVWRAGEWTERCIRAGMGMNEGTQCKCVNPGWDFLIYHRTRTSTHPWLTLISESEAVCYAICSFVPHWGTKHGSVVRIHTV